MNLPADVARCKGVIDEPGWLRDTWATPCQNCARRLSPSDHPRQPWMTPPESVRADGVCEFRIENVEVTT